jgi:ligand-binding SRPBCC domain-containing protein
MRVYVQSILDCPPEKVWATVQTSSLLQEIIHPLVKVVPVDSTSFPPRWQEGATVRCKSYLFGLIPLGTRTLHLERVDSGTREIQSREHDPLIRKWDHLVRVQKTTNGRTLYSDDIEIEAGWLTVLVWLFASWFYRHRQRNWRRVAKRLMAGS